MNLSSIISFSIVQIEDLREEEEEVGKSIKGITNNLKS